LHQEILAYAKCNPTKKLKDIKADLGLEIGIQYLSKLMCRNNLRCYVGVQREVLTEAAMKKRVEFATKFRNFDFDQVVFTDEKTVQNFTNSPIKVRCGRGERSNQQNIVNTINARTCKVSFEF
jgi:hypothetical protein